MGLTDRLAAARGRASEPPTTAVRRRRAGTGGTTAPATSRRAAAARPRRRRRQVDPFQDLKRIVHAAAGRVARPQALRRPHDAVRARAAGPPRPPDGASPTPTSPMSSADRTRISQEIADDILGYGPIEPLLRDSEPVRGHGQRLRRHLRRAQRQAGQGRHGVHRRGAPAPHHRQDRRARSAAASTRRARWWTPAFPTAAASTPSSRRWPSTAPSSPSESSPRTPTPSRT